VSHELIKKSQEIEENATSSYLHAIRILRLQGVEVRDLENVIKKIAIETLIHREIVKGMLKAYEEALKRESEVMKEIEELKPSAREKAVIVRLLKDHLLIESEMIDYYKKLAQELPYPVLKELAESLAKNEEEHHKLISSLIKKYEE
jgi:rubrerythrin